MAARPQGGYALSTIAARGDWASTLSHSLQVQEVRNRPVSAGEITVGHSVLLTVNPVQGVSCGRLCIGRSRSQSMRGMEAQMSSMNMFKWLAIAMIVTIPVLLSFASQIPMPACLC